MSSPVEQVAAQLAALTELVLATLPAAELDKARKGLSVEASSAFDLAGHDLAARVAGKLAEEAGQGELAIERP